LKTKHVTTDIIPLSTVGGTKKISPQKVEGVRFKLVFHFYLISHWRKVIYL